MTDRLEGLIDAMVADRPLPQTFIVPGANPASAAWTWPGPRSAGRAARRRVPGDGAAFQPDEILRYLNRLSDLLFVLARRAAGEAEPPSR